MRHRRSTYGSSGRPTTFESSSAKRLLTRHLYDDTNRQPAQSNILNSETTTKIYERSTKISHLSMMVILSLALVSCLLVAVRSIESSAATITPTSPAASSTQAYGDPIKWSFGGWAPLNGMPHLRRQNGTATSPLPPFRTTQRPLVLKKQPKLVQHPKNSTHINNRRESLTESASNSHEKVRFVAPGVGKGPQQGYNHMVGDFNHMMAIRENMHQQQQQHMQQGPAYAMVNGPSEPQVQFSPPAPAPIVRDQILPAANHNQVRHPHQQQQSQHGPQPMQMHRPSQMHVPMPPPHHRQHPKQARPIGDFHYHQMQQQRHRQMMQQQMAMLYEQQQMHQQRQPPPLPDGHPAQMGPAAQMAPPPYNIEHPSEHQRGAKGPQQPMRAIPRYPGSPPSMHLEQSVPNVGTFKVTEGEHPLIFSHPMSGEGATMMEVGNGPQGEHYGRNGSAATEQQQHQPTASTPSAEQLYAPTLAAIEKDNLNYHNALQQVAQQVEQPQQQQQAPGGNNIQEIKHKQQYEQQQSSKAPSDSKPSYLTIPVAVETEGDKVLTSDDINEIEKHVINVLPNLKTADKIVKIADTHLNLGELKVPSQHQQPQQAHSQHQQQQQQQHPAAEMHMQKYQEHRSTMKQLENDLKNPADAGTKSAQGEGNYAGTGQAASTANAQHEAVEQERPSSGAAGQPEPQYFVAAGPIQEVGTVDPDQLSDYNLIKNDLLNTFKYEPTRASGGQQQSTPSMHQSIAGQPQQSTAQPPNYSVQTSAPRSPTPYNRQRAPATVTRYFQHGSTRPYGGRGMNMFGRIKTTPSYMTGSTKATLGGRKVSEVMRPLIHTTPVPMTTPMHTPSLEPEKVDAIQLIAGTANDKSPVVIEAHQLVSHTPDGGIDYNSGGSSPGPNQQQGGQMQNATTLVYEGEPQNHQLDSENQGAVIEYVTLSDQAINNAITNHQAQGYEQQNGGHQQQQQQPGPQLIQTVYSTADTGPQQQGGSRAPFGYDYSMTTQHQQQAGGNRDEQAQATPPTAYIAMADQALIQAVQQHQQHEQQTPSLAWSPPVANDHQQQLIELSGHAGPMQQMDMPATAGYNFFNNQQEPQQQQQQQQQQEPAQRWRSKAGGSQPNPDAQYDGQIAKPADQQQNEANQHEAEEQQQQQQAHYGNQLDLNRLVGPPNSSPQDGNQQQSNDGGNESGDAYQQQQQQYQEQASTPASGEGQQQTRDDGYQTHANSYSTGAQMDHHANQADRSNNNQQQQQYESQQTTMGSQFNYVKLDRDRQQNHLAQQQAQHQARLAEIMNEQQRSYQTTTPMSLTTLAAINGEQQQQEAANQGNGPQSNGNSNAGSGYQEEQVPSRPSVQSQPESLVVNESPMQMPILDQQSLIPETNQDQSMNEDISDDDAAKQRQQSQPAGVYQVYQAYYAPKDHKPLPGYVRLSLEEFNELFRDAEIQYVDRNLNGMSQNGPQQQASNMVMQNGNPNSYEQALDQMRTSASETQSILVDGRSISPTATTPTERRASNSTAEPSSEPSEKTKLGQAVKKIISIRNSRQLAKQAKTSKLVMKRIKSPQSTVTKAINTTNYTVTSTTTIMPPPPSPQKHPTKQNFAKKKSDSPAPTDKKQPVAAAGA